MLFPVCIHTETGDYFGASIPDIPGCTTGGNTFDECVANVQEAVEDHYSVIDNLPAPTPTPIHRLMKDPTYAGAFWMMIDIDLSFLSVKARKISVTIPENTLSEIDRKAKKLGLNRSAFLAEAGLRMEV